MCSSGSIWFSPRIAMRMWKNRRGPDNRKCIPGMSFSSSTLTTNLNHDEVMLILRRQWQRIPGAYFLSSNESVNLNDDSEVADQYYRDDNGNDDGF